MIEVLQPVWGWDWPPAGLFVWLLAGLMAVVAIAVLDSGRQPDTEAIKQEPGHAFQDSYRAAPTGVCNECGEPKAAHSCSVPATPTEPRRKKDCFHSWPGCNCPLVEQQWVEVSQ